MSPSTLNRACFAVPGKLLVCVRSVRFVVFAYVLFAHLLLDQPPFAPESDRMTKSPVGLLISLHLAEAGYNGGLKLSYNDC
jgi:hypothetical protein